MDSREGLTRRTLVRAAGKGAWAAPVIVLATSTPARAASGVDLDVVSLTANRPFLSEDVNVALTVQNFGAAASNIQVLVTVTPNTLGTAEYNPGTPGGGGGFGAGTPTDVGSGFSIVFTRAASLASDATAACTFSFTGLLSGGSISAQVISPSGAGNNTAGTTYPAL